ncbi:MAG: CbiM family transporter [Bryobacteraceae bacterium]
MHIADGILPVGACLAAQALSWGTVYRLGRNLDAKEVPRMGMMAAATFAVSLIHFPLGGTSIHLGLLGLCGVILGRRAFPVVFATLLFQSLLFQHGGLLTLGVNALNMGLGALLAAALWRLDGLPESLRAFGAGFLGVMTPALLIAVEFSLTGYGRGFYFIALLYLVAAAIEGLLTLAAVSFLRQVKPAVLARAEA